MRMHNSFSLCALCIVCVRVESDGKLMHDKTFAACPRAGGRLPHARQDAGRAGLVGGTLTTFSRLLGASFGTSLGTTSMQLAEQGPCSSQRLAAWQGGGLGSCAGQADSTCLTQAGRAHHIEALRCRPGGPSAHLRGPRFAVPLAAGAPPASWAAAASRCPTPLCSPSPPASPLPAAAWGPVSAPAPPGRLGAP